MRVVGLLVLVAAAALACLLSVAVGARPVPLGAVLDVLLRPDGGQESVVVHELRLPRTLLGVVVGAALGMAGVLVQGLTRNPLADPAILGISAGAAFAVVVGIHLAGVATYTGYVWLALAGAALAGAGVHALGTRGRGGASPTGLVLAGAAAAALLTACTSAVVLTDAATLDEYRFWAVGSLAGRDAALTRLVLPFVLAGALLAAVCARGLDLLALGDDVARSLGVAVGRTRLLAAGAAVVLTGGAVAACGPIAFVALVVPHLARAGTGPDHRWLLAWSAALGPVLLLGADVLGRVVARPAEVPVGVMTALVGAPVFIALVRRRRLVGV